MEALEKGSIYTAVIDGYSSEGLGIARVNGAVVFVPHAVRGEEIDLRITKVMKTSCAGEIVKIHDPSPERMEPECPYAGKCGGCAYRHLTYPEELWAKRQRVQDALTRIGGLELSIFVPLGIILLIISYVVLYKTRFGLRLRACGEHPQAADSVGINVYKMRYAGVVISGALGAIGGMAYIVPPVQTWNFEVGVAGAGFLALAVMIFGQWKPFNICAAAMFFAVFKSLANIADSTFLAQFHWSSNIYNMMPFIASMIILAFTSKNSMAPKAEGIPYDKGSR